VRVKLVYGEDRRIMKLSCLSKLFIFISGMLAVSWAWSSELQRLFTTPEERNALDDQRFRPPPPPPTTEELERSELPDPPRFITFNGMIQLAEYTTVWVNNSTQLTDRSFVVQANADATVSIILPKAKYIARLHAGQTLDTVNNAVLEAYQKFPEVNTVSRVNLRSWLKNWR
jgi:hypothetical protein